MAKEVQVFRDPTSQERILKANRAQLLAQQLAQNANPDRRMAGWNHMPVVPKYGVGNGMIDLAQNLLANRMGERADKEILSVKQAEEAARQKAIQDWATQTLGGGGDAGGLPPQVMDEAGAMGSPGAAAYARGMMPGDQPAAPQPTAPQQRTPQQLMAAILAGTQIGVPKEITDAMLKELEPYTLAADNKRFVGGQEVANNPSPAKPLDELAKLRADLDAGRISLADYMARRELLTTRAPGTTVNVNTEGQYDKEFQKQLAQSDATQIGEYRKLAESGRNMVKTIDDLEARNPKTLSGGGAETRAEIANWLSGWTGVDVVDPEVLGNTQVFNAQTSKMILDSLGGSLGAGVSNADVQFIRNTVPKLEYSQEARQDLMNFLRKRASDNIDLYNRARAYGEEHGGLKGFESFPIDPKTKRGVPQLKANPDGSYTYQQ